MRGKRNEPRRTYLRARCHRDGMVGRARCRRMAMVTQAEGGHMSENHGWLIAVECGQFTWMTHTTDIHTLVVLVALKRAMEAEA